jgi:hypothetical protein
MSLKISPYGYGNTNANTVEEARQDNQYISNSYDLITLRENAVTLTNKCEWKQQLYSERWAIIKQTQQTRFLFGVSQIAFKNTFDNVYSGNNIFTMQFQRTDIPAQPIIPLSVNLGNYQYQTIAALMTELDTALTAEIVGTPMATGSFTVALSGGLVEIVFTPPAGQTWNIDVLNVAGGEGTNIERSCYGLFGLTFAYSGITSDTITASVLYNLWSGLDIVYLTCDAVRWPFQFITQANNTNIINNIQVIVAFPLEPVFDQYQILKYDQIEYKETFAFPFGKQVTFSLVDKFGNILSPYLGVYNFNATMRTQLLDAQDGAGQ